MTPSSTRYAGRGKPARVSDGVAPNAARHSTSADVEADILAEACRAGAGEPVTIHVRPAVYARMRELRCRGSAGIPVVIDDGIPSAPGYEIRRAVSQGWTC